MVIHCKYDELISKTQLKPHPKNRNKHPPEQIARLAQILKYQGWRYPVKVSRLSGFITSGHGRIEAAWLNGWDKVPVNYQDYEDETQEIADVNSDNAIALWAELDMAGINADIVELGPDFDIDLLGIKDFVLDVSEKHEGDEDAVPEVPKIARTKRGELWILGDHRLLCGDATDSADVARLMDGEKADMVFTDPPYGIKVAISDGKKHGKSIAKRNFFRPIIGDESTDSAKRAIAMCRDIPIQIFWGGNYYAESLPPSSCWLVWDKVTGENDFADAELAWTNQDSAVRIFKHQWNGMMKASERGEARVHPTQKPIILAEWCFDNYGNPKSVLDLFLGSGSTLIACEKTQRRCFGMEIDPLYCDVILDRWTKYSGKTAVREDGKLWEDVKDVGG